MANNPHQLIKCYCCQCHVYLRARSSGSTILIIYASSCHFLGQCYLNIVKCYKMKTHTPAFKQIHYRQENDTESSTARFPLGLLSEILVFVVIVCFISSDPVASMQHGLLPTEIRQTSIQCLTWKRHYIHMKLWDVIIHPCTDSNVGLITQPFNFGYWWGFKDIFL